jgi:hypothetical protein
MLPCKQIVVNSIQFNLFHPRIIIHDMGQVNVAIMTNAFVSSTTQVTYFTYLRDMHCVITLYRGQVMIGRVQGFK